MCDSSSADLPRRRFIQAAATGTAVLAFTPWRGFAADPGPSTAGANPSAIPWFRRARRWGQVNLTEIDPARFDLPWWRAHWKRTGVQGVVVNAGGIVAYYPTDVPLHRRAQFLGGRDLFGEILRAAHEDGLAVFARMDSNRVAAEFFKTHPDWFAQDAAGKPYQLGDLFVACVNGPYYDEHIPAILREVGGRYHPEGFTDNNWNGLMVTSRVIAQTAKENSTPAPDSPFRGRSTGTRRFIATGLCGITNGGWRSGIFSTAPPGPRAGRNASGSG